VTSRPRRLLGIAFTAGLGWSLLGCSPDPKGGAGDAPIGSVEQQPWVVLNNIDGYPNVATRCYKGNGIYVTRSAGDQSDALVVIRDDPACRGATAPESTGTPGTTTTR